MVKFLLGDYGTVLEMNCTSHCSKMQYSASKMTYIVSGWVLNYSLTHSQS